MLSGFYASNSNEFNENKKPNENLSYDTMKEAIVEEIMKVKNLNSSTYDVNQKDEIYLKMFKQGEF